MRELTLYYKDLNKLSVTAHACCHHQSQVHVTCCHNHELGMKRLFPKLRHTPTPVLTRTRTLTLTLTTHYYACPIITSGHHCVPPSESAFSARVSDAKVSADSAL